MQTADHGTWVDSLSQPSFQQPRQIPNCGGEARRFRSRQDREESGQNKTQSAVDKRPDKLEFQNVRTPTGAKLPSGLLLPLLISGVGHFGPL